VRVRLRKERNFINSSLPGGGRNGDGLARDVDHLRVLLNAVGIAPVLPSAGKVPCFLAYVFAEQGATIAPAIHFTASKVVNFVNYEKSTAQNYISNLIKRQVYEQNTKKEKFKKTSRH